MADNSKAGVLRRLAIEITEIMGRKERDDEQFAICDAEVGNPGAYIAVPVTQFIALRGFMATALLVLTGEVEITGEELQEAINKCVDEFNASSAKAEADALIAKVKGEQNAS